MIAADGIEGPTQSDLGMGWVDLACDLLECILDGHFSRAYPVANASVGWADRFDEEQHGLH